MIGYNTRSFRCSGQLNEVDHMWTKIAKTLSLAVIGLFVLASLEAVEPDIWHLSEGGQWTKTGDLPSGEYMLAVARIKQMINAGETEAAQAALEKLKSDFADVMGDQRDLDAFTEAEMLYSAGKWNKAAKKYDEFLGAWPNSWLTESALERRFSIANAYLNGQKRRVIKILKLPAYEEGYNIMYKIADRTGDEPIAKRSLITLAGSLEKRKKYMESYEIWADISSRWPTG